jgi:hypothetical protein
MRQRLSRAILAAGLLTLLSLPLAAQIRGRIEGTITDESNAIIPGATVTLINVNTGIHTVRQTSSTGVYIFDAVDPGQYTLTVEATGFNKFTQENIVMQALGDVSVNAVLRAGAVQESVTVTSTPVEVQFNTSNQDLTIDSTMAKETPRYDRNPFKLTLLAPEAINTRGEVMPFLSWSANSVDLGGDTNLKNNLEVDGSPVGLGHKYTYPPNMDDVQEVIVSQNSVDAEQGHSAGGVISLATKPGTNEYHGDLFYLGRYPWLNAEADRTRFSHNAQRQNTFGGTLGNPIKHNKLFNFFSLEDWKVGSPGSYVITVPTALEAAGNFSKSYNIDGGIRTIYDPFSTTVGANGAVTRTPFPGNIIPSNRMDPLSAQFAKGFWAPNNPGANITGLNNFAKGYTDSWNYINFDDRVDWNVTDNFRAYARFGRYHSSDITSNPTPNNSPLYQPTGTDRSANDLAGDTIWTVSPRTVVEFHADWNNLTDAYVSPTLATNGWQQFWPNNPWYQPYFVNSPGLPVYYPDLVIGGQSYGGRGFYWNQKPQGEAVSGKVSQQRGSHFLKAGMEYRRASGPVFVSNTSQFFFNTALTANTFVNPNTQLVGDQFATFLLGALDNQTEMVGGPVPIPINNYWGIFIQDDWKVNSRLTLNLGLRDEYETAWSDAAHNLSQAMDLTAAVPAMQQNPPQMPAQALALVGGSNFYHYTGAWRFTTPGHPGMWNPPALALAPRAGLAFRINNDTALRAGYARYVVPSEYNFTSAPVAGFEDINFLEPPFFGMTGYQFAAPLLNGVPQETISNPFPASNPLLPNFGPVNGKALGTNVGRGGENLLWYPQNFQYPYNDRINVNIQHQLPDQIVASFTYFLNLGHQLYTEELNAVNPSIYEQYANNFSVLSQKVANPFYHYLNTTVMPGPLYNQAQVPLSSLLVPYPQYGPLYQIGTCCNLERYNQFQVTIQKPFTHGYNFMFAYVYTLESAQINNFNDMTYYTNTFQWQDSNQPRHRITAVSTYELPIGKDRKYFANASKFADAFIGGWKLTPVMTWYSGDYPQFGNMIVTGNPCVSNPTPQHWFNTAAFQPIPNNSYVLRNNPIQYGCLTGPAFFDVDTNLAKDFQLTERFRAELRMTAYNTFNNLNRGDPTTNIYDSTFGQALYQGSPGGTFGSQGATLALVSGRQIELSLKILW